MSFDYINEAFKKLEALNEDMFDTSLTGLNNLQNFMDQDDPSDIVKVIDPDAETESEVSDSYIGKVIINCNVCHSHIFENKEDIVIDEDGIVNPEMQCPYCGEDSGFTVVGEIVPFEQEIDDDSEASDIDVPEEEPVETPVDEKTTDSDADDLHEGFDYQHIGDSFGMLKKFLISKGHNCKSKEDIAYMWAVLDLFEAGDVEVTQDTLEDWYAETKRNYPEDLESLGNSDDTSESLIEDVKNVNVETDDNIVTVNTESDGKVVVTTEHKSSEPDEGGMILAPVSDETIQDIESNNDVSEEEPLDLESEESSDDEIDVDIDEVDEKGMDELGESYLKNIYENVESFKTCNVSTTDSKMIVEGIITFKSGVKKNTGFVFEAHSASESGKVKFVGMNEHFSTNNKAFTLTGRVREKKLLPESLTYDYHVGTNHINGIVNKK